MVTELLGFSLRTQLSPPLSLLAQVPSPLVTICLASESISCLTNVSAEMPEATSRGWCRGGSSLQPAEEGVSAQRNEMESFWFPCWLRPQNKRYLLLKVRCKSSMGDLQRRRGKSSLKKGEAKGEGKETSLENGAG